MVNVSQEVHAALGGWGIEYKALMTPAAFDELERRVMALIAAERERCAQIADSRVDRSGEWHDEMSKAMDYIAADIAAQIRALID